MAHDSQLEGMPRREWGKPHEKRVSGLCGMHKKTPPKPGLNQLRHAVCSSPNARAPAVGRRPFKSAVGDFARKKSLGDLFSFQHHNAPTTRSRDSDLRASPQAARKPGLVRWLLEARAAGAPAIDGPGPACLKWRQTFMRAPLNRLPRPSWRHGCLCALQRAAVAGWGPRAAPESPPKPALRMTVLARSTTRRVLVALAHPNQTRARPDQAQALPTHTRARPNQTRACPNQTRAL